ncbi:hypothetical protein [Sporosarcina sp. P2]|uniref:hypothetical protein n=1 Tax=Sporosarcina sp. P2 TaxID=2048251 RepID=UPI00130406BC|nr:hypothetical protein [Sporosarcina sp. P2]
MRILREYEDGEYLITEYTNDGINVCSTVKEAKIKAIELIDVEPTIEEKILY